MEHRFVDAAPLTGMKITGDGYLVADAAIVRTGIQLYAGSELSRPDMPIVRVYRPASEVFSRDSLRSFSHIPVTNDHPEGSVVDAANWRKLAVGETSDEVLRDGERLRTQLIVKDAATIKDVEGGKRELSAGYGAQIVWEAGVTDSGEPYDAVQRNIRANHLAIVQSGRAGSDFRIGDSANHWGSAPINHADSKEPDMDKVLQTIVLGDKAISVPASDVAHLEAFKAQVIKDRDALTEGHRNVLADKDKDIEGKDEEIGKLKAELKQVKDAAPKPSDLDKLVEDRSTLVMQVRAVDSAIEFKGIGDQDLRKAAVAAKLGADFVKDSSDAEVNGMFKLLTKDLKLGDTQSPFVAFVKDGMGGAPASEDDAAIKRVNDARAAMLSDYENAHKPKTAA